MKSKKTCRHFYNCKNNKSASKKHPLLRMTFLFGCLLFPFGLLFALASQQATPDSGLAAEFMQAKPSRRAQIRESWLERGKNAVPEVLPLLNATDVEAKLTSLVVLERAGATEALRNVSAKISDPNPIVRAAAAKTLGAFANDSAIPTLFSALADPDRSVRINVMFALARLKANEAVSTMHSTAIRRDADPAEREAAIISLGNLHASEAVQDLISIALRTDEQEKTRGAALSALGAIGDPQSAAAVTRLTADPSEVVRFNAAGALGGIKGSQAETVLIRLIRNQQQPDFIRIRAAWALRNIGTDRALQELFRVSQTENEFIAMHAVRVLVMTHTLGGKSAALSLRSRSRDAFVLSTLETLLKDAI